MRDSAKIVAGASARGAITYSYPAFMNTFFGTRFRIVTGYTGGNDINLAMERGEVEARTNSWQSWKVNRPEMAAQRQDHHYRPRRTPDRGAEPCPDRRRAGPERRRSAGRATLDAGADLGRPFAAPPGTAPERIEALRQAFAAATRDPDLLAEVAAARMELDPVNGADMQKRIVNVLNTPKAVAERARDYLQ